MINIYLKVLKNKSELLCKCLGCAQSLVGNPSILKKWVIVFQIHKRHNVTKRSLQIKCGCFLPNVKPHSNLAFNPWPIHKWLAASLEYFFYTSWASKGWSQFFFSKHSYQSLFSPNRVFFYPRLSIDEASYQTEQIWPLSGLFFNMIYIRHLVIWYYVALYQQHNIKIL